MSAKLKVFCPRVAKILEPVVLANVELVEMMRVARIP
jgi:hypothetical protein